MVRFNLKYIVGCILIALLLCIAQIGGNVILIMLSNLMFLALLCAGCINNFTLPLLMFFLPWSPILKITQNSFSNYTVAIVLVSMISIVKNWLGFKRYHITAGILLLLLTLMSKMMDGSFIGMDYICFMMLIVLFPVVCEENTHKRYDFYGTAVYFAMGVVIASLCAKQFASYSNIAKYIRVHSYQTITRRCGFYGDPNFYMAQITAALGGCLVLILKERAKTRTALLGILLIFLLYCGLLSGSKSFVLVSVGVVGMWIVEMLRMRGRLGLKMALILCGIAVAVYIATSSLFKDLIDVLITRFSASSDIDTFTTGRTGLWKSYYDVLMGDAKVLAIGKGFTNVKVNTRGSHNTIIQMIFQFGIIGSAVLIGWIACFYRSSSKKLSYEAPLTIRMMIILFGVFFPWMAIDALFFDEFFLMQWYVLMGMMSISDKNVWSLEQETFGEKLSKIQSLERERF